MTDLRQSAEMALESLRGYRRHLNDGQPCDAERALEAALEQPSDEPVAWMHKETGLLRKETNRPKSSDWDSDHWQPLYTRPQPAAWVGLTDEEIKHEWEVWRASLPRWHGFAKGIEAKLKEKNT